MIPEMTDPLGKHWEQPRDIRQVPIVDGVARLRWHQFKELPEYSRSLPSGVYPGKCWKAHNGVVWFLRWYGIDPDPSRCTIESKRIEIVTPAEQRRAA